MEHHPKVLILMGSSTDLDAMAESARVLERLGVSYALEVTSAHRSPERTLALVAKADRGGCAVFIVGAGMAAHLAGVVAAHTTKPVLGVPMEGKLMGGVDALLSTVQMPRGVPVATLAMGKSGAYNAAVLACQILALGDPALAARLSGEKAKMAEDVAASNDSAQRKLGELLSG